MHGSSIFGYFFLFISEILYFCIWIFSIVNMELLAGNIDLRVIEATVSIQIE